MLIKIEDIHAFLKSSVGETQGRFKEVLLPNRVRDGDEVTYVLSRAESGEEFSLDGFRAVDPLKVLLYAVREQVFPMTAKPVHRLIAGIKACDLRALKILDKALINEDFVDPAYKNWRDSSTIISADCTEVGPACHCTLVGGNPHPDSGFDLNLSRIGDKYEVTAGSEKGRELLDRIRKAHVVQDADDRVHAEVKKNRARMKEKVEELNASLERPQVYAGLRRSDSGSWIGESRECVGCGACTNICPTCYCLILNEEGGGGEFAKVRSYDSCQWHGYARVAGGASPRPRMHQRFRNRYLCKFLYLPENFDELGCTGCGRCTEACPGEIDFRSAVRNLMTETGPAVDRGVGAAAAEKRGG